MTMTVIMMDAMTNTMVNSMYFPISGTALEVEGISSTMTRRNTVRDSKTEILSVIFSPKKTKGRNATTTHSWNPKTSECGLCLDRGVLRR